MWVRSIPWGGECDPPQLLDTVARIDRDGTPLHEPAEELADGDEVAVDRRDGQPLLVPLVGLEVGHIAGRDPTDDEPLSVPLGEPEHEPAKVVAECTQGVRSEVVRLQELEEEGRLAVPAGDPRESLITPKPTHFHTAI